jgi:hypothetical protein
VQRFPSENWFDAVRAEYNEDLSLHSGGGGACDTAAGMEMGDDFFRIVFAGHRCASVDQIEKADMGDLDFVIEMPIEVWQEMLEDIQRNGKASANYTLNSIDLRSEESIAYSPIDDQYRQDLFYRYNQNFQDFMNASARIETSF